MCTRAIHIKLSITRCNGECTTLQHKQHLLLTMQWIKYNTIQNLVVSGAKPCKFQVSLRWTSKVQFGDDVQSGANVNNDVWLIYPFVISNSVEIVVC
jgi:hypothetical protein